MFQFSDEYIRQLFQGIWDGTITEYELPENLYHAIADYLKKGVYEGFGIDFSSLTKKINEDIASVFDETDLELLSELRENIYMFSAAKTFTQISEMSDLLAKTDNFFDFKEAASAVFDLYNDTYLKTEYDTAIGQAQSAVKWNSIEKQKEVLPYLRYSAVMDANTSEICAPLDGTVAKVDDPIWNTIAPLNHFNCRCLLEQMDKEEGEDNATPDGEKEERFNKVVPEMQDVFKMNPGKDGYIFDKDHPYFQVAAKDKEFAKENFNLPIPKKDGK